MFKQIMVGMMFLLLAVTNGPASAQDIITFENIPGVGIPQDRMEISTQFRETAGVTFVLEGGGFPQIAQVGAPATAFRGPPNNTTPDTPVPGQDVGTFFLTDNGQTGGTEVPPLIVQYDPPTAAASGVIIDIDLEESFTIEARDANGTVIEQLMLPGGQPGTGDGIVTPWSFDRQSDDIYSIRFVGVKLTSGGVGLAFDNFSARSARPSLLPLPIACVSASDAQSPHVPANTIDDDLNTYWSAQGNGQWIRYELASQQEVNRVDIAWHRGDQRTADFSIESSADGMNWMEVFRGTSLGTTLNLQPYTFADVNAVHIRILGFGNTEDDSNSITEVRIFSSDPASGATVDLIGAVPGSFTTDGGDFVLTVSPRDADGNLITEGVTTESFDFRNVHATRLDDSCGVIPVSSADVTEVVIENVTGGESVTLVLDFDSSGSMSQNDPNRLRVAAGKRILQFLQVQDRVAVMDFGAGRDASFQWSRLLQDFTSDRLQLEAAIDRVTASGGTPLYASLLEALDLLATQAPEHRGVVVLTDGESNAGSGTPIDVVSRANQLDNTPVCTIGLGSGVGIPPLQDIARETGCTFAQADDASALDDVFEQIARGLIEGRVIVSAIGRFAPPLAAGSYTVSGVVKTTLDLINVDTPFRFPVEVSLVPTSITRRLEQVPGLPYTAEEEAAGLF